MATASHCVGQIRIQQDSCVDGLRNLRVYDSGEVEAFYVELEKLYEEGHIFYKVNVGDFKSFTSASMVWSGTNRVKGCPSLSCRRTPSMVTLSSRNLPPDDGLGSLQVDCTKTKLTT
ncbi:unnamed protein product [Nippostrongylus brasiliensis]|uniref:Peptidase S1 domain-containing protein n=1 Tax=Nippostrongylus brasiliensis TaxID=27835 RepID=A0A0N4XX47_NIPBR|nr:unnamed protein product [Nippostrongylus brasiliensis]